MQQEHKRRVFRAADEAPVKTDPPLKAAEEFSDLVGDKPVGENGWMPITDEQKNGRQFLVTADTKRDGVPAFWRRTRSRGGHTWIDASRWSHSLTRQDVKPEPLFYKEI